MSADNSMDPIVFGKSTEGFAQAVQTTRGASGGTEAIENLAHPVSPL